MRLAQPQSILLAHDQCTNWLRIWNVEKWRKLTWSSHEPPSSLFKMMQTTGHWKLKAHFTLFCIIYFYTLTASIIKTRRMIFTFGCCILLRIYLTGSLWRRQSQQSFNTLTPFLFSFLTHYMFRPLRAILMWDIQLDIRRTIFNTRTTDPLHVCNLIWGFYLLSSIPQLVA
jgi:hypothetical protein